MRLGGLLLCLCLFASAPLLAADTPRFELSGAYSFMHDTGRAEDFPAGWAVSAAGNVNDWIGVVAEAGGGYRMCNDCQRGPFASQAFRGTNRRIRVQTYLGGPRVATHAFSAVTPFAQLLVGGSHISGGVEFDGALNSGLTYQPGAGIDIAVAPKVGLRLQGDYRVIRTQGRHNKEPRFLLGVVFQSGP